MERPTIRRFYIGLVFLSIGLFLLLIGNDREYTYLPGMLGLVVLFGGMFVVGQTPEGREAALWAFNSRLSRALLYAVVTIFDFAESAGALQLFGLLALIVTDAGFTLAFARRAFIVYDPIAHDIYLLFLMGLLMLSSVEMLSFYFFIKRHFRGLKEFLSETGRHSRSDNQTSLNDVLAKD